MPEQTVAIASFFFFLFLCFVVLGFFFSPTLWSTTDARNLFNSAASRPISNAKAKAGRAIQPGSPSSAPASTANMIMAITVALL